MYRLTGCGRDSPASDLTVRPLGGVTGFGAGVGICSHMGASPPGGVTGSLRLLVAERVHGRPRRGVRRAGVAAASDDVGMWANIRFELRLPRPFRA